MLTAGRIELVDQLRGLAALSVAWFHMTGTYSGWVHSAGSWGWLGVEVFFVISGFVIPLALDSAKPSYRFRDYPTFLIRRVIRLEPAYLISIALFVALNFVSSMHPNFKGEPQSIGADQVLAHLFYLIPLTKFEWLQPVYWTLAYEFSFYLVMGIIFPLVGTKPGKHFAEIVSCGILLVIFSGLAPVLLALFVIGFAIFRHFRHNDSPMMTMLLLAASGLVMISRGAHLEALVGLVTAGLLLLHKSVRIPLWPIGKYLTSLGAISYSLYLIHVPIGGKIVNLGQRFVQDDLGRLVLSLLALALSVAAATVLYWTVERPCIQAARRFGRPALKGSAATDPV